MPNPSIEGSANSGGLDQGGPFDLNGLTVTDANRIVAIICIGTSGLSSTVSSIQWDFGGTPQNFVQELEINDGNFERIEIWTLDDPAPGNKTCRLVTTFSSQIQWGIVGVLNAGDVEIDGTFGTGANPSDTMVPAQAGDLLLSAIASDVGNDSSTSANSGTQLWEAEDVAFDSDFLTQQQTASGANEVFSFTSGAPLAGGWVIAGYLIHGTADEAVARGFPGGNSDEFMKGRRGML